MRRRFATIVGAVLIAVCTALPARDLGVRGAVWPPLEADLLASIGTELLELERSGELQRLEDEAAARARARIEAPEPVAGIAPATTDRTRLFDPSVTVENDILGPHGAVIAAAGARVNPLAYRPLTGSVLFIDGTRPAEVRWALAEKTPTRIVLLAGRPLELARTHGRTFYFDQGGALAGRFGLTSTPSRITQHELLLRIDEIELRTADVLRAANALRSADDAPGSADVVPPAADVDPPAAGAGSEHMAKDEENTQ